MSNYPTRIEKGNIEDRYLPSLAGIVYEAFEAKITALGIQKEVAIEIITNSSRLLNFCLKELRKHFNPFKAVVYYLILNFDGGISKDELAVCRSELLFSQSKQW